DGYAGTLLHAPSGIHVFRTPHAEPARTQRDRISDRYGYHGRKSVADNGKRGARHSLHRSIPAADDRLGALHSAERYAVRRAARRQYPHDAHAAGYLPA